MKRIALSAIKLSLQLAFTTIVAVGLVVSIPYIQDFASQSVMPAEDKAFVRAHPVITYGAEANYPPMIYLKNGHLTGISMTTINQIERKTGIKFNAAKVAPLAELMAAFNQHEIELITSVTPTREREEFMAFTDPYKTIGTHLLYTKTQVKTVGVGNGFGVVQWLRVNRPQWTLVSFPDDEASMRALVNGQVDGVVMDSASAIYLMDKLAKTFNSEPLDFTYTLAFGVTKENKELIRFLNSTLKRLEN